MSLRTYNKSQLAILRAVKDDLKHHLGKEIDRDPQSDPAAHRAGNEAGRLAYSGRRRGLA